MYLETDLIDLLLDSSGDIVIDGDLQFVSGISGIAQECMIAIRMFAGEWFLDLDEGVPYWQDLLGHKYDESRARAAFRDQLLAVEGVAGLSSLTTSFVGATRSLVVAFRAITEFGDTPAITFAIPF